MLISSCKHSRYETCTLQEPCERVDDLREEEVVRLSGELEWLREEARHGGRKVEELEDQVRGRM